jgi:teichuronic acid exporter
MAYRLMMMPLQNLTHVITPVLLPVLSDYQHDKVRIYNSYMIVVKILAIIGFPLSIFLYFSAENIIYILYGNQWNSSIPVFKILSLTIGLQMVLSSSGSIFQTLDRTDLLFYSGLLSAIITVTGISYGVFIVESIEGVGVGLIVAYSINFFQSFYLLINKAFNKGLFEFLYCFIFPASLATMVFIALFLVKSLSINGHFFNLLLNCIIFSVVLLIGILLNQNIKELIKNFFKK